MDSEDDAQSMSPSQSSSPPRPHAAARAPNGRGHVTIAAPPRPGKTLGPALALPIQNPRPGSAPGGREDCWSEGATSALIDAWGERFLELGRGNLRQKQWQEVADAVSSRDDYTKTPKTDIQCKNRIDTLKKKYKAEKSKRNSHWPFFNRLDHLIRPGPTKPSPSNKAAAAVAAAMHPSFPKRSRTYHPTHKKRSPSLSRSLSAASSSSDSYPPLPGRRPLPDEPAIEERVRGLRELSQAIVQFGTVYERVETSKLRQTMEMEKLRMELARELQLQRIHFLIKTQAELSHLRQPPTKRKRSPSEGAVTTSNNINNNNSSSKRMRTTIHQLKQ